MNSQAVADALAAVVGALGLEIDRVETAAAGKRSVLRIFLDGDGPEGRGPSLDDIAEATRAISAALDDSPAPTGTVEAITASNPRPRWRSGPSAAEHPWT